MRLQDPIHFILVIVLLSATLSFSCRQEASEECRKFFDLPQMEREAEFQDYPLEKQFDLYSCGMRREPPQMGFAWDIARNGEKTIPFLIDKLEAEKNEYRQRDIILIFNAMGAEGHLRNRRDVVEVIRRLVLAMKSGAREMSQEMLGEIEASVLQSSK